MSWTATWITAHLIWIKMERGCIDCGFRGHPAALDFDHVEDGKEVNLSKVRSIPQMERELDRCVVRCANCHRIRHANRWTGLDVQHPTDLVLEPLKG
jgi:hypothetical protein